MTIELLPAVGVRLPASFPELRFGMSRPEVRRAMEGHVRMRPAFVCRSDWADSFRLAGCSVVVCASNGDELSGVSVSRQSDEQAVGPVAFLDIDLFGWPAGEIVAALRSEGQPVVEYESGNVWVGNLHLSVARGSRATAPARRKPRRQPPPVFDYVGLYRPGMR